MNKKRIGLISDTHIPSRGRYIPPRVFEVLDGVDMILHAGDVVEETVLHELKALAPVQAVAGNMDPIEIKEKMGEKKVIQVDKFSIALIHGEGPRQAMPQWAFNQFNQNNVHVIVFGHSHMPFVEQKKGVLLVNPGSPVDPRGGSVSSCGHLIIDEETIKAEILPL